MKTKSNGPIRIKSLASLFYLIILSIILSILLQVTPLLTAVREFGEGSGVVVMHNRFFYFKKTDHILSSPVPLLPEVLPLPCFSSGSFFSFPQIFPPPLVFCLF